MSTARSHLIRFVKEVSKGTFQVVLLSWRCAFCVRTMCHFFFIFHIRDSFIFQALTLHFVVLSFDRYSRDDVIGEVMLELETLDLSNSDNAPVPISKEITPRSYKVKSIHHDLIFYMQSGIPTYIVHIKRNMSVAFYVVI